MLPKKIAKKASVGRLICADTSFLIHLWRERQRERSSAREIFHQYPRERFALPATVVGEFLEGGACISDARLRDSQQFIQHFLVLPVDADTALHYARITAGLRAEGKIKGRSKADLWIAASACSNGAELLTKNVRDFDGIPGLRLITF